MKLAVTWPKKRLGDLAEFRNGVNYNSSSFGVGVKVVGVSDFQDYTKPRYAELDQINPEGIVTERNILRDGDIVFVRSNGNRELIGRSLFIEQPPEEITHSAFTIRLRFVSREVHPKFYAYCFRTPLIRNGLTAQGGGTNINNLNQDILNGLEVPLPPLPTQRRIAGILSAYDELMENSQRRIRILEEMVRALYREWFVHFRFPGHEKVPRVDSRLGDIPRGWEVGRLDDVLVLQRGFDLPKADRAEGTIPIYAATGVTGFHSEAKVKAPGVVTGRSGTIGEVLYVQEDFWPLNTALWVKEFPKAEPLYAYYVLSSLDLKQFNSGAAVPTLNRNDIHGLDALIPPRALQKRFQEIAGVMLAQTRTLEVKIQNLRRTRDLLLPRLLSGQVSLDVSAVEDVAEPTALAPPSRSQVQLGNEDHTSEEPALRAAEEAPPFLVKRARNGLHPPAEPADEAPVPIDQIDRTEVLQVIRQVFSEGPPRERDAAIRDVARTLGYRRTGPRIQEILHTDLMTAVRRCILENQNGTLRLGARSIIDYDRDFLKRQFLAAIGRTWVSRDTVIRDFCRWLGFARTGPVIEDTARSLINGLLREGRLETDGALIRRV